MTRIFGLIVTLLFSQLAFAASVPDFPFVVSVGHAEREVTPDTATISLDIMSFEKDSKLALKAANLATTQLMETLKKNGVPEANVEASDIEKATKRRRDEYRTLDILGYEVSRTIKIKLDDLSKYSELMSDLVAIDNLSKAETIFDVSNRREIEAELMEEASKDAREKAERMAGSLGTKIQSVYAISQKSNFGEFFATFGVLEPPIGAFMMVGNDSHTTVMFVPDSISVEQSINVVFRIK